LLRICNGLVFGRRPLLARRFATIFHVNDHRHASVPISQRPFSQFFLLPKLSYDIYLTTLRTI
jgi:hypothetical protein